MFNPDPKNSIDYGTKEFIITRENPLKGFANSERPERGMAQAIIAEFIRLTPGLEICLRELLEYDIEDFSLAIRGTPKTITDVGGESGGYEIAITLYPSEYARLRKTPTANSRRA